SQSVESPSLYSSCADHLARSRGKASPRLCHQSRRLDASSDEGTERGCPNSRSRTLPGDATQSELPLSPANHFAPIEGSSSRLVTGRTKIPQPIHRRTPGRRRPIKFSLTF